MKRRLPSEPLDPRRMPAPEGELFRRQHRAWHLLASSGGLDRERRAEATRELLALGPAALPALRGSSQSADAAEAAYAGALLRLLVPEEIGAQLAAGLQSGEEAYPPELGAALLARLDDPNLSVEGVLAGIDRLAELAGRHVGQALEAPVERCLKEGKTLEVLFHLGTFWREAGFKGEREAYEDPRSSWLPAALERKTGLPITLAVLFVALCRRLGLNAEGVGLPAHFIARLTVATPAGEGLIFVDAFNGAKPLDLDDCRKFVEASGQTFDPDEHLKPSSPREILNRICQNLLGAYDRRGAALEAERVATVMLYLNPGNPVPLLIRAERRIQRGDPRRAREDLHAVLNGRPEGQAALAAKALLKRIEFEQW